MRTYEVVCLAAMCFCLAPLAQIANAQQPATVRIGGYSLTHNNKNLPNTNAGEPNDFEYKGGCPATLKFEWSIISTAPTTIKYKIERSDNAQGEVKELKIPKANVSVYVMETWDLGANNTPEFKDFKGWENLVIADPHKADQKLKFTLHCK